MGPASSLVSIKWLSHKPVNANLLWPFCLNSKDAYMNLQRTLDVALASLIFYQCSGETDSFQAMIS